MTPKEIKENYLSLAHQIKDKLGLPAWKKTDTSEIIFGERIHNIHSFMTEGSIGNGLQDSEWEKL